MSVQPQYVDALRQTQQAWADAATSWTENLQKFVPSQATPFVPADSAALVDRFVGFGERLVEVNSDYAQNLVEVANAFGEAVRKHVDAVSAIVRGQIEATTELAKEQVEKLAAAAK